MEYSIRSHGCAKDKRPGFLSSFQIFNRFDLGSSNIDALPIPLQPSNMASGSRRTDYHSSSGRSRQKHASDLTSSEALKYNPSSANEPNFSALAIWEKVAPKINYANAIILILSDTQEKKSLKKFLTGNQDLRSK